MFASTNYQQFDRKVGGHEDVEHQIDQTSDPFKIFTENFDLSLLPNAAAGSTTASNASASPTSASSSASSLDEEAGFSYLNDNHNIPITVYQYNEPLASDQQQHQQHHHHHQQQQQHFKSFEIKVETSYQKNLLPVDEFDPSNRTPLLYEHLCRQRESNRNYLLPPPPPYPNIYPSPQSSPSQSDYNFSFGLSQNHGFYESLASSRSSLASASPCPSVDSHQQIKQEFHILPPSPPDSNFEAHSPRSACTDIKSEPFDIDTELPSIDLKALLEQNQIGGFMKQQQFPSQSDTTASGKREEAGSEQSLFNDCLEGGAKDEKLSLRNLALESFIEGLDAKSEDFEPVISLAFEHVKKDAEAICNKLQISQDPTAWSSVQVHAWLRSTIEQFKLPQIENLEGKFIEDGSNLLLLSEEEFVQRVPQGGSTLHAQLEIWKMVYSGEYKNQMPSASLASTSNLQSHQETQENSEWSSEMNSNLMDIDDESDADEDAEISTESTPISTPLVGAEGTHTSPVKRPGLTGRSGGSHIHLWQFLKELLQTPQVNGTAIRWIDRTKGIFKIEDSVRVAKLWGKRKNRPAMNYDKLSRSIRQYYKKGIMKKTERSQRLVYQFCHPYYL